MDTEFRCIAGGFFVRVDKVGGGTPGKAYDGDWTVTVRHHPTAGSAIFDRETLTTGTPKTHREVAEMAADFASEEI